MKHSPLVYCFFIYFILFLISLSPADADKKVSRNKCDPPCGSFGTCFEIDSSKNTTKTECQCNRTYYGKDCKSRWIDDGSWATAFLIYSIADVIAMMLLFAFCAYHLFIIIRFGTSLGWRKWTVATWTLTLLGLGCLIRAIEYAVDPHAVREILPPAVEQMLYTIAIIAWFAGAYALFLYWVELNLMSGIKEVVFLSKLKPVLITLIVLCIVLLVPIAIVDVTINDTISNTVYNIVIVLLVIVFMAISITSGVRLRRTIKNIYSKTKSKGFKKFLLKITVSVYSINAFLVATIITIVILVFGGGNENKWMYFVLHCFLRVEECGIVMSCLFVLHKKVPTRSASNSAQSTNSKALDAEAQKSATEEAHVQLHVTESEAFGENQE